MTEGRHVEKPVVDRAKRIGIYSRKMNGTGFRGWPDRMFCFAGGKPLFIEFKLPGEEPTELQWENITRLRGLGYDVAVCDSKEDGWLCLNFKDKPGALYTREESQTLKRCFQGTAENYKHWYWSHGLTQHPQYRVPRTANRLDTPRVSKAGASVPAKAAVLLRMGRPRGR